MMEQGITHGDDTTARREVLTFRLGAEEYGIDILKVQEIRGYEPPTRIARVPKHLRGVMNLRGNIVPVVDMRLKLQCAEAPFTASTVIIVLNLIDRVVGMVVDAVSDVLHLAAADIGAVPELHGAIARDSMRGLCSVDGRMLILLDIEHVMCSADMGLAPVRSD